MTLQLTPALEQRLAHLAMATHRTPDELAQEAIDLYLQDVELLTMEVREAEEEADRGLADVRRSAAVNPKDCMKVLWTPRAASDLEHAANYIAEKAQIRHQGCRQNLQPNDGAGNHSRDRQDGRRS